MNLFNKIQLSDGGWRAVIASTFYTLLGTELVTLMFFVVSYYIPLKFPLCPGSDLLEAIRGFPCGLHSFASATGYFYPLILPPTVSLSPSDF